MSDKDRLKLISILERSREYARKEYKNNNDKDAGVLQVDIENMLTIIDPPIYLEEINPLTMHRIKL